MSVRVIKVIPDTKAYQDTLRACRGDFCPIRIGIAKVLKTNAEGYNVYCTNKLKTKQGLNTAPTK